MTWTRTIVTPPGGDATRVWTVDGVTSGSVLIYCHGVGGNETEFGHGDYGNLRAWLHSRNWAVIEVNAGGPGWGNNTQRNAYRAAFDHLASTYDIADVVVFGRSMGGIIGSWLYLYDTAISPLARGLILCSGVQDMTKNYDTSFGGAGFKFTMDPAYSVSSLGALTAAIVGHNPIDFPTVDYSGKSVLFQYGDADPVVPQEHNTKEQYDRLTAAGVLALATEDVAVGGDHYTPRTHSAQQIAFIEGVLPAPPDTNIYRRINRYLYQDGKRYTVTPHA